MLSTHLPLMPKLRLLPLHILMEWTEQCSSTIFLLINSWTSFEIGIFSFSWQEMLFTSTLFQTYMKKTDWLYLKQRQLPFFLIIVFPVKCAFFSLISFLIYLYITSYTVFIFCVYSSLLLFCWISGSSLPIKYVSPKIMCQQWSSFIHVTP
jgi:hypothetical protein